MDECIEQIAIKQSLNYKSDYSTTYYANKIKINIVDNKIVTSYTEANHIYTCRVKASLEFIEDVLNSYNKPISLSITICLDDKTHEDGIMVASGCSDNQVLIPDFYAMLDKTPTNVDDSLKNDKAIFIGVSTGSYDPKYNERLKICDKYKSNENVHCYINNICQMTHSSVASIYPDYITFCKPSMSHSQQLAYKYIISIDGNTCAWNRPVWVLKSKSILLMHSSNNKCWYYDHLLPNVHYVPFDYDTDIEELIKCPDESIIKNANQFANDFLTYDKHKLYMGHLLYHCSLRTNEL